MSFLRAVLACCLLVASGAAAAQQSEPDAAAVEAVVRSFHEALRRGGVARSHPMGSIPGQGQSSFRHWHETEDEFVFVVQGEVVLVEDHETTLHEGDSAAWKAGVPVGHCLENRSDQVAQLLVVGTRAAQGAVHDSDYGIVMQHDAGGRRFYRTDGSPIPDPTGD